MQKPVNQSVVETCDTLKKAEKMLAWYRTVENGLNGKKKFYIKADPATKKYQIIMVG
jgi:hypothetical protein